MSSYDFIICMLYIRMYAKGVGNLNVEPSSEAAHRHGTSPRATRATTKQPQCSAVNCIQYNSIEKFENRL